jgi:hypothetical protein
VCVSPAREFAGCPAGARQQAALPSAYRGSRVLLHRGERFGDIGLGDGEHDVQIGAYGSGAAPQVNAVGVGAGRPDSEQFAHDITVMDLSVGAGINQCLGHRVLIWRNRLHGAGEHNGIYFGGVRYWAEEDPWRKLPSSAFVHAREIFIVENQVLGSLDGDGYNLYGEGAQFAILGYHVLKLHSGGLKAYDSHYSRSGHEWASDQVVLADNLFGNADDNNQWTVAVCPQNDSSAEGLQDVILERNRFARPSASSLDLVWAGRRLTQRGNQGPSGQALRVGTGHAAALPAAWRQP